VGEPTAAPAVLAVPAVPGRESAARALSAGTLVLAGLEALAAARFWPELDDVRALLAGAVLLLAAATARPAWRLLTVAFVAAGAMMTVRYSQASAYEVYRSGMLTVTPVVALLVVVTWLNAVVTAGRYHLALAASLARRGGAAASARLPMLVAYLLAPVLLAGALAQSFGAFQSGRVEHDRGLLTGSVRAISLGLVWSPMAAPTAFALTLLDVPVLSYVAIALPASLLGFGLLLLTSSTLQPAERPDLTAQENPAKVRRLLGFLFGLPLAVGALAAARGQVSLHVVLLVMSVATAAWFWLDRRAAGARDPGRRTAPTGLAAEGVALYLSLGVLLGGLRLMTGQEGLSWASAPAIAVAVAFLGAAAGFLLGVHPVVVIAVLAPTVLALGPEYGAVGAFALCAGAQAVNVSTPFSPLSVVGSALTGTTPWRVSAPVHWRFSLHQLVLYGGWCAAALALSPP